MNRIITWAVGTLADALTGGSLDIPGIPGSRPPGRLVCLLALLIVALAGLYYRARGKC